MRIIHIQETKRGLRYRIEVKNSWSTTTLPIKKVEVNELMLNNACTLISSNGDVLVEGTNFDYVPSWKRSKIEAPAEKIETFTAQKTIEENGKEYTVRYLVNAKTEEIIKELGRSEIEKIEEAPEVVEAAEFQLVETQKESTAICGMVQDLCNIYKKDNIVIQEHIRFNSNTIFTTIFIFKDGKQLNSRNKEFKKLFNELLSFNKSVNEFRSGKRIGIEVITFLSAAAAKEDNTVMLEIKEAKEANKKDSIIIDFISYRSLKDADNKKDLEEKKRIKEYNLQRIKNLYSELQELEDKKALCTNIKFLIKLDAEMNKKLEQIATVIMNDKDLYNEFINDIDS